MALYPFSETNPANIDELYLCDLHPNWNSAREWREYMTALHQERTWRRGDTVTPPIGHYRRDHMLRWLDSHEYGSLITASLPVRRAQDNMKQTTRRYIVSFTQEIILRLRLSIMKQLREAGVPSMKPRMDRAVTDYKNCRLVRALRHQELHGSITEWILTILSYTRNTYYPHLRRET